MKALRIVLVALVALAVSVVASANAQTLWLTLDKPSPEANASFGRSVAMGDADGDGTADTAVGAFLEDVDGNNDQGRAYVFSGADGSLLCTLDTPNAEWGAWFGHSVAMGDVDADTKADIVVGAHPEDAHSPGSNEGRAYVFSGADCSRLCTLETPNSQVNAEFGVSVAVGHVNDDGKADIAVGARREDVGGYADQGRIYVFSGVNCSSGVVLSAPLFILDRPGPPQAGAQLGFAVALGDVNGDGNGDIVGGATEEDVGGHTDQGRAYVFSGVDGSLLCTIDNPNPEATVYYFAGRLAVGDVSGDAKADIAVNSPTETNGGVPAGRAHIYSGADCTSGIVLASPLCTLDSPNPESNGSFGHSVAVGDVDGDGSGDILASANQEDVDGSIDQGRAYVFSGTDCSGMATVDTPIIALDKPSPPQASAYFSYSVAVGEVNGDGYTDIALGATNETVGDSSGQGRAYVFLSPSSSVGGIAELPDGSGSAGHSYVALAAAAVVALSAGGWYAWRWWLS
jgi:hypothetical protein